MSIHTALVVDALPSYVAAAAWWASLVILGTMVLQNLLYMLQFVLAFRILRRWRLVPNTVRAWRRLSDTSLPISLLVPAYNEEATVVANVRSMLALHYPRFEIIVVNDGSNDATLQTLIENYDLRPIVRVYEEELPHQPVKALYGSPNYPNLIVVDKENGGKADALNAGINMSRLPMFCVVDADSILEADSLLRAVQPFSEDPDRVIAVGGTIRIANGSTVHAGRVVSVGLPNTLLPLFQIVEYLRAFLIARLAWSEFNALMLISGAFGIFRRSAVVAAGGYSHGTVGEDMEIIIKLHRYMREHGEDYVIRFVPDPVCWTEAPETLDMLGRQRKRWQRGALESFFKHIRMLFNPRYGVVGLVGFPYVMLLDVIGPPVELLGYFVIPLSWYFGFLDLHFFAAYLALTFAWGVTISVGALVLEEMDLKRFPKARHLALLGLVAILENFGYRQINNLWRVIGYWHFLRGRKEWGHMARSGFKQVQTKE
ncbi:MAG: glycosyltransferase family 2 protein [Alphaproteobacteria bacterium]|nr:glycosyltransferase family 2 protein [Alphaproteobacteria bacterium]